jgi:hypothetical protein
MRLSEVEEVHQVTINFRNLILTKIFNFKGLTATCHSFCFLSCCTVYNTDQAREQNGLTTLVIKGSLTRDFLLQVFFLKQFPPGPLVSL